MTQEELAAFFINPVEYQKTGAATARLASAGEKIITIIDGEVETINTAAEGDVVITGPKGEQYIIDATKFEARYKGPQLSTENQDYKATGTCFAVQWKGEPIEFKASWGETMIIKPGDFLCNTTREANGDLYRVEAEAFTMTYKQINNLAAQQKWQQQHSIER